MFLNFCINLELAHIFRGLLHFFEQFGGKSGLALRQKCYKEVVFEADGQESRKWIKLLQDLDITKLGAEKKQRCGIS